MGSEAMFYELDDFDYRLDEPKDLRLLFPYELSIASACVIGVGLLLNFSHVMTICIWNRCASTFMQVVGCIVLWDLVLLLCTAVMFVLPSLYPPTGFRIVPLFYPYLVPVCFIAFAVANLLVIALACDRLRQVGNKYQLKGQGCVCFGIVLVHILGFILNFPKFWELQSEARIKPNEAPFGNALEQPPTPPRAEELVVTEGWVGRMPEYFLFSMGSFLLFLCALPWMILFILGMALPIRYIQLNRKISKQLTALGADSHELCDPESDIIFGSDPRRRMSVFHSKSSIEFRRLQRMQEEQKKTKAVIWILMITILCLSLQSLLSVYMSVVVDLGGGVMTWELEWMVFMLLAATRNFSLLCLK